MGSTYKDISEALRDRSETIADYLADIARGRHQQAAEFEKCIEERSIDRIHAMSQLSYYKNIEFLQKYCAKELQLFAAVFAQIGYPFAWDNPILGEEFCQNVRFVVEESASEFPRRKKWESVCPTSVRREDGIQPAEAETPRRRCQGSPLVLDFLMRWRLSFLSHDSEI